MKKQKLLLTLTGILLLGGLFSCSKKETSSSNSTTSNSQQTSNNTSNNTSSNENSSTKNTSSEVSSKDTTSSSENNSSPTAKIEPTVNFVGEKEYSYDGKGHTPTFTVTKGVEYEAHYTQNELFYSTEAPSEKGTYALVVVTKENNTYLSVTKWFVFSIVSNLPECTITFSTETRFVYDGNSHTPTFTVTEGVEYESQYDQNDTLYSYDAPINVGTYALVVTTKENEHYRSTKKWIVFEIVEPTNPDKKDAEIIIEEGYKHVADGQGHAPEVTLPADLTSYTIRYESESTGYNSTEMPTAAAWYAVIVTVKDDPLYNDVSVNKSFELTAPVSSDKIDAEIIIEEGYKHVADGQGHAPEVTLPEDLTCYTITYESEKTGYNSTEMPTVAAWYAVVVDIKDDPKYNDAHVFKSFELTAPSDEITRVEEAEKSNSSWSDLV